MSSMPASLGRLARGCGVIPDRDGSGITLEGFAGPDRATCRKGEVGCPAYPLMAMPCAHLMQNRFGYSDIARDVTLYETTILRKSGGRSLDYVDLCASSTKNQDGKHDLEIRQIKKGNSTTGAERVR